MFGRNETGGIPIGKARRGEITHAEFDNQRGGAWTMDLSKPYGAGRHVLRHVIHLLPRVVVVLDEAKLEAAEPISLRWHTITRAGPDDEGRFAVRGQKATLASCVRRLDGQAATSMGRHEYRPPYDKNRYGRLHAQRREPFVEIRTEDDRCRILSAFCVFGPDEQAASWQRSSDAWSIDTPEGTVRVQSEEDQLAVENLTTRQAWRMRLRPPQ